MNKRIMAAIFSFSLICGHALAAIPYNGTLYQYEQPNGDVITLSLHGNTYYAEQRTLSGQLVIYDNNLNGMAYAVVSSDGQSLVSTNKLVTNAQSKNSLLQSSKVLTKNTVQPGLSAQAKKTLVLNNQNKLLNIHAPKYQQMSSSSAVNSNTDVVGDMKGLTILIDFPDQPGVMQPAQIERFLNATNYKEYGNYQSVRGYFLSVSGGKLDYKNTVTAYYTAKNYKSYYTDPNVAFAVRAQELISEALNWLENQQGFDFSTLTTNNYGQIKGLNVMYAGKSDGAWSQGLWPHMGGLNPRFCADGVCTDRYQISDMNDNLSIGTFIHESGHLIADWPDLYDYDGSSQGSVASYGIMGFGGVGYRSMYHPTPPVAPLRDLVGWDEVTELNPSIAANAPQGQVATRSASNTSFKWSNPDNSDESFYIEAIHQSGQNTEQLGSGLAIFHVDKAGNNNDEWHPYIQMEHADGNRDPENNINQGDANDLYHRYGQFSATFPNALTRRGTNSLWWDGSESGLNVSNVSEPNVDMTFNISSDVPIDDGDDKGFNSTYYGYLAEYQQIIEPDGSYFEFNGNNLQISSNGSANTDFGISLYQLINNQWQLVASSQTPNTSQETIYHSGGPGYYYVVITAYRGAGQYALTIAGQ